MPKLVSKIHDPHYTWIVADAALRKYSQEAESIGRSDQNLKKLLMSLCLVVNSKNK